jgi:hypothetical protein
MVRDQPRFSNINKLQQAFFTCSALVRLKRLISRANKVIFRDLQLKALITQEYRPSQKYRNIQ